MTQDQKQTLKNRISDLQHAINTLQADLDDAKKSLNNGRSVDTEDTLDNLEALLADVLNQPKKGLRDAHATIRHHKAYVPDGYYANGKSRPMVEVEIVDQNEKYYRVKYPNGQEWSVPHYAVTFTSN